MHITVRDVFEVSVKTPPSLIIKTRYDSSFGATIFSSTGPKYDLILWLRELADQLERS